MFFTYSFQIQFLKHTKSTLIWVIFKMQCFIRTLENTFSSNFWDWRVYWNCTNPPFFLSACLADKMTLLLRLDGKTASGIDEIIKFIPILKMTKPVNSWKIYRVFSGSWKFVQSCKIIRVIWIVQIYRKVPKNIVNHQ